MEERSLFVDNRTKRINGIIINISVNEKETTEHKINKNQRPLVEKEKTISASSDTIQTESSITKILNIPARI